MCTVSFKMHITARRLTVATIAFLCLSGLLYYLLPEPQDREVYSGLLKMAKNNSPICVTSCATDKAHGQKSNTERNSTRHGYVLTVRYNGQQSAGIRSLISQRCWIGSSTLPMLIVEPFLHDSYVEGIRTNGKPNSAFTLADYFDMDWFESSIHAVDYGRLVSWENFLNNAPRDVILVQAVNVKKWGVHQRQVPKILWETQARSECYLVSDEQLKALFVSANFCTRKVVKIHTTSTVAFTEEELHKHILKGWHPSSLTLVFDKWVGAWHIPPNLESRTVCDGVHEFGLPGNLHASKKLIEHARKYELLFNSGDKPFGVAVMIRSEHLLIKTLEREDFYNTFRMCLREVSNVTDDLMSTKPSTRPFVTVDIGKYGSTSFRSSPSPVVEMWRRKALKEVRRTVLVLFQGNMTFDDWEDSFPLAADGIQDRGYIAALQRTVASRADCLVLVGGGQFLKLALHMYLRTHPLPSKRCIHFVCIGGRFRREYEKILKKG